MALSYLMPCHKKILTNPYDVQLYHKLLKHCKIANFCFWHFREKIKKVEKTWSRFEFITLTFSLKRPHGIFYSKMA